MGCLPSKSQRASSRSGRKSKPLISLKEWRSDTAITREQLAAQREEFWDTQPYYGGNKVVWETLRAVMEEPELDMKSVIIETAGLIVGSSDLSVFYDETGWRYELPKYVISDPLNLVQ